MFIFTKQKTYHSDIKNQSGTQFLLISKKNKISLEDMSKILSNKTCEQLCMYRKHALRKILKVKTSQYKLESSLALNFTSDFYFLLHPVCVF